MSGGQPASAGSANAQLALTELWPCTTCNGTGRTDPDDRWAGRCPVCDGTGTVDYDPLDLTLVGF